MLGWLRALPDALLRDRPVLSNAYAGALLSSGLLDGVEVRLRDAERWLDAAGRRGIAPRYVRRLLAASGGAGHRPPAGQELVEPLSERELDVLRLLGSDLDGPDIARELVVSLNTVRTHTKSIYSKLGVNTRRAAVRRAEALGLLPRASTP